MIELPEAVTLAKQMKSEVAGKRAAWCTTGTSPHKWVFYRPDRKQLERKLAGRTVVDVTSVGRGIHVAMDRGLTLVVDDFGGRVLYHDPGSRAPSKHHLLIRFDDDSFVTVAIQGWGFLALLTEKQLREHVQKRASGLCPLGRSFTFQRFDALFKYCENQEKDSIKTFFTNGRNVAGIGNGYLPIPSEVPAA